MDRLESALQLRALRIMAQDERSPRLVASLPSGVCFAYNVDTQHLTRANPKYMDIRNIPTFGAVAAEDEPVLNYFVETDAVTEIAEGEKYLV